MDEKEETQIKELTRKVRLTMEEYRKSHPEVQMDKDYTPFKITEEWGECLQVYLMLTGRGRKKGMNEKEINKLFAEEFADVFAFLLIFAEENNIDPVEALEQKWFKYLKKD